MTQTDDGKWRQFVIEKLDAHSVGMGALKTDVSVLKADVSVLKADVSVLKTDVADLKVQVRSLGINQESMSMKLDQVLEIVIATQKANVPRTEIEAHFEAHEIRIGALEVAAKNRCK